MFYTFTSIVDEQFYKSSLNLIVPFDMCPMRFFFIMLLPPITQSNSIMQLLLLGQIERICIMCIRSNNSTSSSRWLQRDKNCNLKYLLVKVVSSKTIIYHINYLSCQTFHIFKNFYLFKVEIFWLPRAWLSQENGPNKVSFSNTKDCMYMPNLKIQIKNCSKQSDRYF